VIETGARRREIDEVASELFHMNGYAATSVRDIARALDIQGASLYAHVASKEDVLFSIVDRAAGAFERAADAAEAEAADGDPVERLADPERASVFVTEWRHLSAERRAAISARRDAYERRFREVIEEGIALGAFRASDSALAATFILTALNGIPTWYRPDGRLSADRIADHYVDLALRALSEDRR
jgi:AcrR family transcriptional regulator